MKKYIVETYYTCTFKTVHSLNSLNEAELSNIDQRTDGKVEVIDVKLNNRKTRKIGDKKDDKSNLKVENVLSKNITEQIKVKEVDNDKNDKNQTIKNNLRFKMPDRRKRIYSKGSNRRS